MHLLDVSLIHIARFDLVQLLNTLGFSDYFPILAWERSFGSLTTSHYFVTIHDSTHNYKRCFNLKFISFLAEFEQVMTANTWQTLYCSVYLCVCLCLLVSSFIWTVVLINISGPVLVATIMKFCYHFLFTFSQKVMWWVKKDIEFLGGISVLRSSESIQVDSGMTSVSLPSVVSAYILEPILIELV